MELLCCTQLYHWGSKGHKSLVGRFASANSGNNISEDSTYAEFWMGTHPNGPSLIKATSIRLSEYISSHPEELGSKVLTAFGSQLPFLFKILSVAQPLSIQAHPTKVHAEELFKKYPTIYKDNNHKPEIAIAVTKFKALCGFRTVKEIKFFLKNIPEFEVIIDPNKIIDFLQVSEDDVNCHRLMKECFQCLMLCDGKKVHTATETLMNRLDKLELSEKDQYFFDLIKWINMNFPNDVGIFCVYWLNYLVLSPGQALYLAPNEPHAYLKGDCIECMANSDNVVRAGLTPKFRDIPTLVDMLSYKNYEPANILFNYIEENEYSKLYAPPIKDFSVAKIVVPKGCKYFLKKRESASILLVFEGFGKMNSTIILDFGKVFYLKANSDCNIESDGISLFQAFCNV